MADRPVHLGILFLLGCSIPAELAESDRNKTVTCTDTRDGEVFQFSTNDVEMRIGTNGIVTDVVDSKGIQRHITDRSEAWLKCRWEMAADGNDKE